MLFRLFAHCGKLSRATAIASFALTLCHTAGAETSSQPVSAVYADSIEPLLTPIDSVLQVKDSVAEPTHSGVILLNERFVWVDDLGRRSSVWHLAYRTLTDAGVRSNGEDVFTFRKHEQRARVILAETIQADGTRQSVQPNAIFVQSPQRQAQYSLYDDQSELKIIFPNVTPGSTTHLIVLIEDLVAKIPQELNHAFVWGGTWAAEHMRIHLDVPDAIAARLKIEGTGSGLPATQISPSKKGRIQYRWTADAIRSERYEVGRAPSHQVGPVIRLSTLGSWNAIGRWYQGLLDGRDILPPELIAEAEKWTEGATSRAEIISRLHARVADDIRYVGLEFGAADYQPHACAEVWSNRYGDCKDKANLLTALLRHHGIPAWTALINTEHQGLIDQRVPDYRVFDHAIVAIPEPDGGYLFCDPTISYSTPGMLSPRSSNRDALVITHDGTQWVRTPDHSAGELNYSFDLKLDDNRDLSGWITLSASGYYGAAERRQFMRLDADEIRSEMSNRIRQFYPAAEVIDAERIENTREEPLIAKAYFTLTGAKSAEAKQALPFPSSSSLLVNVGDKPDRQTTFFTYRDRIQVRADIALPDGYEAAHTPAEFALDCEVAKFRARWSVTQQRCHAEMDLLIERATVSRDEFPRFYQAVQSLQAWVERPMLFTTSGAVAASADKRPELDLPMMPTGDGQIELVDKRYPDSGDPALRRLALERTIQYFPKDKHTVFRAGTRIGLMDWNADRNEAAHQRLSTLLADYAGHVPPETYAWADTLNGLALRDMKRLDEAQAVLERIARDSRLSSDRRGRAGVPAAELISRTSLADALALLLEVAALPDGATASVTAKIAQLYLRDGRTDELKEHLTTLANSRPDTCDEDLAQVLQYAESWNSSDDAPRLHQLTGIVDEIRPTRAAPLSEAISRLRTRASLQQTHTAFLETLAESPLREWHLADQPPQSAAAYTQAIEKAGDAGDAAAAFRLCLQAASKLSVDAGFSDRLWRAASYADWVERQGKTPIDSRVCEILFALFDRLPTTDDNFYEGRLLRAKRIGRLEGPDAEIDLLRSLLAIEDLPEKFRVHVPNRLARLLIDTRQDYDAALALYQSVEKFATDYRSAAEGILGSAFINLHRGNTAEALRAIDLLSKIPERTLNLVGAKDQIAELIALVKTGKAEEVWNASRQWWPEWRKFSAPLIGTDENQTDVIPLIASLSDLGVEIGTARRDKDTKTYFKKFGHLLAATRWLPSLGLEVGSLYSTAAEMTPERSKELRDLVIVVLETPHPLEVAGYSGRTVQLAAHYIDGGRPSDALKLTADFDSKGLPLDATTRAIHRLRGLASVQTAADLAASAAILESDLVSPQMNDGRGASIGILADLYRKLNRADDEEKLLRAEIANPVVIASADTLKTLDARLKRLIGERDFTRAVDDWREKVSMPWFEFSEPRSLADTRLRNLESVLQSPQAQFSAAEQIKLNLLAATDVRRPVAKRQESLRAAVHLLIQLAPTYTRFHHIVSSVADNTEFDDETRINSVWLALIYLSSDSRKDDYARWRKHPLCERFNDVVKRNVGILDRLMEVDRTSERAVLELARAISQDEIRTFDGFVLSDLFDALLNLGALESATEFVALVPSWNLASDVAETAEAKHLEYSRRLRVAKAIEPVHARLSASTLARFPGEHRKMPKLYADLRVRPTLAAASAEDMRQACLHQIRSNRFPRGDLSFWSILLRSIADEPGVERFIDEAFAAAVNAAETDDLRSSVVWLFVSFTDSDNPDIRAALQRTLRGAIDPIRHPGAHLAHSLYDIRIADRLDELDELETALTELSNPLGRSYQQRSFIRLYTRRNDTVRLRQTLDSVRMSTLLGPSMLDEALPAFAFLEMTEELAAARRAADADLRKNVVDSWVAHDNDAAARAVRLAFLLEDSKALPPAWIEYMRAHSTDPAIRHSAAIANAYFAEDWKSLHRAAAAMNRDYPTHYHYYWFTGLAAHRLGDVKGARAALTTYVNFSKDEQEYADAQRILEQLETDS